MKYRFLADYRHRWPSRAHTEYKAGMVMTLKREVVDYALPRGLIEPVRDERPRRYRVTDGK
jgi:hypothetical protein